MNRWRHLASVAAVVLLNGTASGALLFEHELPTSFTPQLCSSCQTFLHRGFDAFDLAQTAENLSIEAVVGFDPAYPSRGTTPINVSVWNADRETQLFAQDFLPSQLAITDLPVAPMFDVMAQLGSLVLPAGTYYLSLYNGSQVEFLGWNQSPVTVHGRAVQTLNGIPVSHGLPEFDLAFRVFGDVRAVPEPSSLVLAVLTLVALIAVRRKREVRGLCSRSKYGDNEARPNSSFEWSTDG